MAAVARLGPNYSQIPVNRPLQTARNYLRDGQGTIYNQEGNPTYYPNSLGGPECNPNAGYNSSTEDNFDQATNFWNMLTQEQQEELVENIVESLSQTAEFIKKRTLSLFKRVDNIFHHKVQNALMEADKPK
ncbi:Catalase [Blattella germanica]|nr:Catalase [Blattella germanica]